MKESLEEIVALAHQMLDMQRQVADAEELLKDRQARLRRIQTEDLPNAMSEAGLRKFTLDSGEEVTVKEDFEVRPLAERRSELYDWLTKHGFESIIKTEVSVAFGKNGFNDAQALAKKLADDHYQPSVERNVHPQTLKAFVGEQVRASQPLPMDLFGAVAVNKASIKAAKSSK